MTQGQRHLSLTDFDFTIETDTFIRAPLWMIGPRSYFSDRAVPQLEIVAVPARTMAAETLRIDGRVEQRTTSSFLSRKEKIRKTLNKPNPIDIDPARYYADLRQFGLGNWSHCLNQALPVAILLRDHCLKINQLAPIYILSMDTPSKIRDIFDLLDLSHISTNACITSPLIDISVSNSSIIHQKSREFISSITNQVSRMVLSVPQVASAKVFLNRKPPYRSLINNEEIKSLLNQEGYQEVFMEDLSAEEQIALIIRATDIVAIHGAALAPLMFRNADHGSFRFIEIGTPGHIVPFFRNMVEPLPCFYRMVRGLPNSSMLSDAYMDIEKPSMQFTEKHSLKPFRLDPASLQFAIESMDYRNFPSDAIEVPRRT